MVHHVRYIHDCLQRVDDNEAIQTAILITSLGVEGKETYRELQVQLALPEVKPDTTVNTQGDAPEFSASKSAVSSTYDAAVRRW